MKPNVIVVVLVIIIVVLASVLLHVWNEKHESNPAEPLSPSTEVPSPNGPSHTEYLKSSLKDRPKSKYTGPKFYDKLTPSSLAALQAKKLSKIANVSTTSWDSLHCEKWAVVTTINAPTTAVQKQAHISAVEAKLVDGVHSGWCLLVVADTGSPDTYEVNIPNNKFTYLSVSRQKELANTASRAQKELYQALPWGHVGRKNAGYLYALHHGARYIYDFDDDVLLLAKQHTIHIPGETINPTTKTVTVSEVFTTRVPSAPYDAEVFNPFPLFEANHNPSWPRGFPPERILTNSSTHEAPIETATVKVPKESIGVVQYLANHDPDVDSMYRLVRPLPLDFPLHGVAPLILPGQRSSVRGEKVSVEAGVPKAGDTVREARHLAEVVTTPGNASVASAGSPKNSSVSAAPAPRSVAATAAAKLSASVANKAASVARPTPTTAATSATTAGTTSLTNKGPNPLLDIAPYTHTVYAPYNSQSTLHTSKALFALLLPLTAHRRVSDIWRSYIAQRLFAEIGVRVAFHSPNCAHVRKSKDSDLPDMLSELPLYADSLSFVHILRAFVGTSTTLPGRMEELYVHLHEQGFIGKEDVNLVQKWIAALLETGYDFPSLV
eukprot:CAMPEP_0184967532 /NCGR_PEP_ID=MMETSP1098-20130426/882_1 /TAXON_ID=89044 /ORGANISM="Spumella elongata, Strain CCAP 955/1" /LENGTH=607 /DNA_ID=CAMNT_0027489009 /DNA_START=25 /DNA_END=1848 /DNA_ORIENTATION=+